MTLRRTCAILASLALVTGCGGGSDEEPAGTTAAPAEPEGLEMTVGEGEKATTYRVAIDSLADDGTFVTLNGAARCVGRADGSGCSLYSDFSASRSHWDFSGIRLLDRATQTGYQAITNADATVVDRDRWASNTGDTAGTEMERGAIQRFWVRYASPPAGTPGLDVLFPGGGPVVLDHPLERGGVDASPLPEGWLPDGEPGLDHPLEGASTEGLDLNTGQVTATVTSKRARTVQREGRRTVTLAADVLFDFDEATLDAAGEQELATVAADARAHADGPIAIDGYTDAKGSEAYNRRLSQERAQTVADRLAPELDGAPLRVTGHGEADPVAPNTTDAGADDPEGRARNRRVTVSYALKRPAEAEPAPAADPADPAQQPEPVEWDVPGDRSNTRLRAQVHPVERHGAMAIARVDVTCVASDAATCGGAFGFSTQTARTILDQGGGNLRYASDLRLHDAPSGSTYTPAYATDGTQLTAETGLSVGRTSPIWAYYVAPPPTVDAITVRLPAGGPEVTGVPVG